MEQKKNGPITKQRVGRFQVSIWKREKVVPADADKFSPERKYEIIRACVQYSVRCHWILSITSIRS